MNDRSFFEQLRYVIFDPLGRRQLLLRLLRILNFTSLIVAFWPLILMAEYLDRGMGPGGLLPSGLLTLLLGLVSMVSVIPLYYRQRILRRELGENWQENTASLQEMELHLYPEREDVKPTVDDQAAGKHSARALGETDAYKAWRKQTRLYWTQRILNAVGTNVIRALMMLFFGLGMGYLGYRIGLMSGIVLLVSTMLLVLYCFELPSRSYGEIFKSTHYSVHMVMVVIVQVIRSALGYPAEADFHLFVLFYLTLTYFLTRNQANIDHLMRQGSRSLRELPHGLRSFNAKLTSLLILAFPVIYGLRRPLATAMRWIKDTILWLIVVIIDFIGRLLPDSEELEPIVTDTPPATDGPPQGTEGGYWLRAIMTALVITLIIYLLRRYGRQMIAAVAELFRRIKRFIQELFRGEFEEEEEVEEGRYYTDYHRALDPKQRRRSGLRARQRRWREDYKRYRKRYRRLSGAEAAVESLTEAERLRYREGFALALRWLDLMKSDGLELSATIREIAKESDIQALLSELRSTDLLDDVITGYEDLRYGPDVPGARQPIEALDLQLEQMYQRL